MKTNFMSYNEAKIYLKPLGLKTQADYDAWWNANKPDFLPRFPEEYYGKEPKKGTETLVETKSFEMNTKEKSDLLKKVSGVLLSKKENRLFEKILEKGLKNWSATDVEFLTILYDLHHIPKLSFGGLDISNNAEKIRKEIEIKRESASNKLMQEPYSMWFKNVRNYK